MKTIHLHAVAAVLALGCIATLALGMQQRRQATELNRSIANPPPTAQANEHPRVTLARGLALSQAGDNAGAQRVLQLALQHSDGALQNQARFALGNLALRQALKMGSADEKLPAMLELAKQQYRDTLLRAPGHLAARYNLERALWLAPEEGLADAGKDENTSREFKDAKSNDETTDEKEQATTTMKSEAGALP